MVFLSLFSRLGKRSLLIDFSCKSLLFRFIGRQEIIMADFNSCFLLATKPCKLYNSRDSSWGKSSTYRKPFELCLTISLWTIIYLFIIIFKLFWQGVEWLIDNVVISIMNCIMGAKYHTFACGNGVICCLLKKMLVRGFSTIGVAIKQWSSGSTYGLCLVSTFES